MAKSTTFTWNFPNEQRFMRIEVLFLLILGILVFFLTANVGDQRILSGLIYTVLFLVIYFFISFGIRHVSTAEEKYAINSSHMHVTKRRRSGTTKTKVPLKKIIHHKLDKFFLGGYVITSDGIKHLLFFNTKTEVEKFEKFIKKHTKS